MKLLLYCTKAKPSLMKYETIDGYYTDTDPVLDKRTLLNGKIVAECDYEVEEIGQHRQFLGFGYDLFFETETLEDLELQKKSCLNTQQLNSYFMSNADNGEKVGYAIHIKNLHIFDEPKELSECTTYYGDKKIENAPKNMQKIFFSRKMKPRDWIEYILMSVKPEEMCRIVNKEQTTLVRKVVLKDMLNNE